MSIDECLYHSVLASGGKRVHIGVWQDEDLSWGCTLTLQELPFTSVKMYGNDAGEACYLCCDRFSAIVSGNPQR